MKIAFLTPEFPHPRTGTSGGIGTSIKNLSKGLTDAGHQVVVLVYGQDRDEFFEDNGVAFHRIKNRKIKGFSWLLTRKKIQRLINRLWREGKIELVEAPDWTGITAFMNIQCPVIVRLNGSDTYFCHLENRPVKWFNRLCEKTALRNADALLSVSQYTAEVTTNLFRLYRPFEIIPNSIDTSLFAASAPVKNQKILYFGTLIRKKGLLELPHIFNELHKTNPLAELILVGRDSSDTTTGNPSTWAMMQPLFTVEALARVTYLGSVPYDEIRKHIPEAAVCVFPSFAEALPVSWIEAMAMRKAIVASDIGWAKEVIEDGKSGFLVHPENHREFARKIALLLDDESLRDKVGSDARGRAIDKFDIGPVARQNIQFYQSVAST